MTVTMPRDRDVCDSVTVMTVTMSRDRDVCDRDDRNHDRDYDCERDSYDLENDDGASKSSFSKSKGHYL